jgi:hypothetical protein
MTAQRAEVYKRHGSGRYLDYVSPGKRSERGGFRTKGEARERLEKELRLMRTGRQPDVTLEELVDRFLIEHEAAPRTLERMKWLLGKATKQEGDRAILEIRPPRSPPSARRSPKAIGTRPPPSSSRSWLTRSG